MIAINLVCNLWLDFLFLTRFLEAFWRFEPPKITVSSSSFTYNEEKLFVEVAKHLYFHSFCYCCLSNPKDLNQFLKIHILWITSCSNCSRPKLKITCEKTRQKYAFMIINTTCCVTWQFTQERIIPINWDEPFSFNNQQKIQPFKQRAYLFEQRKESLSLSCEKSIFH